MSDNLVKNNSENILLCTLPGNVDLWRLLSMSELTVNSAYNFLRDHSILKEIEVGNKLFINNDTDYYVQAVRFNLHYKNQMYHVDTSQYTYPNSMLKFDNEGVEFCSKLYLVWAIETHMPEMLKLSN